MTKTKEVGKDSLNYRREYFRVVQVSTTEIHIPASEEKHWSDLSLLVQLVFPFDSGIRADGLVKHKVP